MSSLIDVPVRSGVGRAKARSAVPAFVGGHASLCPPYKLRSSIHLLDEHPDRAAARQPDFPGGLVSDAEFNGLRLAALDHVERLGHDRAFDAAARHAAK